MSEEYKLTYFKSRGIGESIRLLFKLAEVPFEDIRVDDEVDTSGDETAGSELPFSYLPALQVGNRVLSKSEFSGTEVALCRYLANKFKLTGADEYEAVRCDQIVEDFFALRSAVIMLLCEQTHNAEQKDQILGRFMTSVMPVFLDKLSKTLEASSSSWFVGQRPSWTDVFGAYTFEFMENIIGQEEFGKAMKEFPLLLHHYEAVYSIPPVKAWIAVRPPPNKEAEHMLQFLM